MILEVLKMLLPTREFESLSIELDQLQLCLMRKLPNNSFESLFQEACTSPRENLLSYTFQHAFGHQRSCSISNSNLLGAFCGHLVALKITGDWIERDNTFRDVMSQILRSTNLVPLLEPFPKLLNLQQGPPDTVLNCGLA